jgi:KIF-1 binding protein C terminal
LCLQVPQRSTRADLLAKRAMKPANDADRDSCDEDASQSSMDEAESGTGVLGSSQLPFQALVTKATGVHHLEIERLDSLNSFEACRAVFKKALAHFQKALDVLVLDGYVTDHCGLLALVGKLYKYVSRLIGVMAFCDTSSLGMR